MARLCIGELKLSVTMGRTPIAIALILLGTSLLYPLETSAQSLPELQAKSDPAPYVRLRQAAQVSAARVVVGVVLDSKSVGMDASMMAYLPSKWMGESICARLLSPDALFEAVAEYDVGEQAAGRPTLLSISFDDDDLATLQRRKMDRLALTVSRGGCDMVPREYALARTILSSRWIAETLTLFVNSQGAARVTAEVFGPGTGQQVLRCDRSAASSRVGFDYLCNLEVEEISAGSELRVRISRRDRFGGIEPPSDIVISTIGHAD